jgi:hypothetical protein
MQRVILLTTIGSADRERRLLQTYSFAKEESWQNQRMAAAASFPDGCCCRERWRRWLLQLLLLRAPNPLRRRSKFRRLPLDIKTIRTATSAAVNASNSLRRPAAKWSTDQLAHKDSAEYLRHYGKRHGHQEPWPRSGDHR